MLHVTPNNSVQTLINKKATLIAEAEDQKTASVHAFTRGSSEHKYSLAGKTIPVFI